MKRNLCPESCFDAEGRGRFQVCLLYANEDAAVRPLWFQSAQGIEKRYRRFVSRSRCLDDGSTELRHMDGR